MQKNSFLNISMPLLLRGAKSRGKELRAELKAAYLAPFSTPESRIPTWVFPGQIMQAREYLESLGNSLEPLRDKPTVLFWGMKDLVFPPVILEAWKKRLSNYKFVELPEANHFFQEEEPEIIANEIRAREG